MWILSLIFSTRCHPHIYLAQCYKLQKACHSFSAYGGDTDGKNQEQSNMRDMQCLGEML